MLTTYKENASASIGTTEYSMANDSATLTPKTDPGVYQLFVDFNAMAAGDAFQVTFYEKVTSAGTQRRCFRQEFRGVQAEAVAFPALSFLNGWDMTIKKLQGTDRTLPFSIRKAS